MSPARKKKLKHTRQKSTQQSSQQRLSQQSRPKAPTTQQAAPAQEPRRVYLDVAVVRIQAWLSRSAKLVARRGASKALEAATSKAAVTEALSTLPDAPAGLGWNSETGEISGVASVSFPSSGDAATDDRHGRRIGLHLANSIRSALPEAPLMARWQTSESYLAAYGQMVESQPQIDLPESAALYPGARLCEGCRSASALVTTGEQCLCADCAARHDRTMTGYSSHRHELPQSQRTMLDIAEREAGESLTLPDDFGKLAEWGRTSADDASTHVATIFGDANRVGELMKRFAVKRTAGKDLVVAQLDRVTKTTIARAAVANCRDGARLATVTHLAGGDDILVSVPAQRGWAFARDLMRQFTACSETLSVPDQEKLTLVGMLGEAPSLSLGMVFHHHTSPFSDVVEGADGLLHEAKRQVEGREASLCFLDLTTDGGALERDSRVGPTAAERTLSAKELEQELPVLNLMAEVPAAQRNTLRHLVTNALVPEAASEQEGESPTESLARRVKIMGYEGVKRSYDIPEISERFGEADAQRERYLRRNLDIARWWPTEGVQQ